MLDTLFRALGHGLAYLWRGPRDLPRSLKLDWRLVAVRWLGIFFVTPGLFLMDLTPQHRIAAYGVLLFATGYNLTIHRMIRHQIAGTTIGFVTTVADSILNLAMLISISNGFDSPFAYFLFSMIVSVAMRYGYGPAVVMTAIFAVSDATDDPQRFGPRDHVRSTIGLGHDLGLLVTAEGVEDQATWDLLNTIGCDIAQGYYVGRPMEAVALAAWLGRSSWFLTGANAATSRAALRLSVS